MRFIRGERHERGMDYDVDALRYVRSGSSERADDRGSCWACNRGVYRTPLTPGVPTEWRHTSSGHAVSWRPEKHVAGLAKPRVHAHRWVEQPHLELQQQHLEQQAVSARVSVRVCEEGSCGALLAAVGAGLVPDRQLSEKDAKMRESRLRGASMSKQRTVRAHTDRENAPRAGHVRTRAHRGKMGRANDRNTG